MSEFLINLMVSSFIIVPEVFQFISRHPVGAGEYLRLAWLASSLATVGGALGSGLESDAVVRTATYGSREHNLRKKGRDR
jgi:hypothetical protein